MVESSLPWMSSEPPGRRLVAANDPNCEQVVCREDEEVRAVLLAAYAPLGGVCDGDEVLSSLRCTGQQQPLSLLARLIVDREVIAVCCHGTTLLPIFQFDRTSWLARADVRRVVRQLRSVLDALDLGLWFATPNVALSGRCPASEIDTDAQAVLQAARLEHFIARW